MITNVRDKRMNKLAKVALLASVISLGAAAKETKTEEQSFSVSDGASFTLDNVNGRVEIEQGQRGVIEVVAVANAKNEDDLARIEIVMVQSGNSVTVETEYEDSGWGKRSSSGGVEYTVKLPASMSKTSVDLVNGSLTIKGIDGNVQADLVNGSIKVEGASGDAILNSVNGSITLKYDDIANVNDIDADTVNGSIKISLPEDAGIKVDAETMHGSIKSDFGLSAKKNMFTGKHMKGSVGSGDISLTLESVNGSIKVLKN